LEIGNCPQVREVLGSFCDTCLELNRVRLDILGLCLAQNGSMSLHLSRYKNYRVQMGHFGENRGAAIPPSYKNHRTQSRMKPTNSKTYETGRKLA
jgi:hypothetical protein